ncbi:MAG: iron-containing alcohol dehydrogenase [Armatimonadetes bacterium]|nr:iron-containing alcohol dehydrogenase [Armatimonadota bacterium]
MAGKSPPSGEQVAQEHSIMGFTFTTPGRVVHEWGGATGGRLADEAKRFGTSPLVVAGASLQKSGKLDAILDTLRRAGLSPTVHTGVPPEPDLDALQAAMNAAEYADSVIAIGGGSVLDVAKGAAALAGTGASARDYHAGRVAVPDAVSRPIIAVPTTAGTGSEATWVGVYTDKEAGRKASIRGGAMMPVVAFLDAELTVSCPPDVTAYSGMDAFVQAVEAYTSVGANPLTDALAFDAAKHIAGNLFAAFDDGADKDARKAMLLASYMAGVALNTSRLGLVHGLAHPVGAVTGAAHGLLCGLLFPEVIRFNAAHVGGKYEAVNAAAYDAPGGDTLAGMVEASLSDMRIPHRLSEIGLREQHIEAVAQEAMTSGSTKANPRPVTIDDARAVLLSCL